MLGSLSLLFNPTGLVRSMRAGVGDLIGLPLAALQNQSLTQARRCVGAGTPCTVSVPGVLCARRFAACAPTHTTPDMRAPASHTSPRHHCTTAVH